jgi:hypothetical protein
MGLNDYKYESLGEQMQPCKMDYERLIKETEEKRRKFDEAWRYLLKNRSVFEFEGELSFATIIGELMLVADNLFEKKNKLIKQLERENT